MNYEEILEKYNQTHIFDYIKMMNNEQKERFLRDIERIDFEQMKNLFEMSNSDFNKSSKQELIEDIPVIAKTKLDINETEKYKKLGEEILKKNEYAVVTMAGGQGTRLGYNKPKGTFYLDVKPEPKSLFQILKENLDTVNSKYGIVINWYIMTSKENNTDTVEFFEKNNYFGYDKSKIKFFIQGEVPVLNREGKILFNKNLHIKFAADGNGAVYDSLNRAGYIDEMKKNGVKWIFIGAVDNSLLNMVDELFLGVSISQNNMIASKTLIKNNPCEKVGVFCKRDSKPCVIEYSEMSDEMINKRNQEDELVYGEAHIGCNLFKMEALDLILKNKLKYHSANKKMDYMQKDGEMFIAKEPNGYKYETFIFDAFENFDNITLYRGIREEDFAPVKNAEGIDSPETSIKLYNDYHFKNN